MATEAPPASARLAQTRSDITLWLAHDTAAQARAAANLGVNGVNGVARAAGSTANRVAGVALGAVADGLMHRATQSPSQTLVHAVADAGQALLRPSAQSHPWALVASAAAGGALLALGCKSALRPAGWGRWLAQWAAPSLARAAVQALRPTRPDTD